MKAVQILILLIMGPSGGLAQMSGSSNSAAPALNHIGLCAHFIPQDVKSSDNNLDEQFHDVVLDILLDIAQDQKNQGLEPKFTRDLLAGKLLSEAETRYKEKANAYRYEYRDMALRDDEVNTLAWTDHFCDSALYIVKHYPFKEQDLDDVENEDSNEPQDEQPDEESQNTEEVEANTESGQKDSEGVSDQDQPQQDETLSDLAIDKKAADPENEEEFPTLE
jgi:hypothetical protein